LAKILVHPAFALLPRFQKITLKFRISNHQFTMMKNPLESRETAKGQTDSWHHCYCCLLVLLVPWLLLLLLNC
jgi:hypothetical protein